MKIIDLDLARRRISLSIKQAAEGGELAEEYREHFGIDEQGNYTVTDDAEREAAWAEYFKELGEGGGRCRGGSRAPGAPACQVRRGRGCAGGELAAERRGCGDQAVTSLETGRR